MTWKSFRVVLVSSVLLALIARSAFGGEDAETIISRLQKKYDSLRDMAVTFTQHVQFAVTKAEQSFSGKLLMKKGNKYRIEMEQRTIVTDGKSVWSYNTTTNQVLIDRYKDDPKSFSPDKVLLNIPGNYTSTLLGRDRLDNREVSVVKLVPKVAKSQVKWMKVWVDTDDWVMKKVQVLDASENLTTYLVTDSQVNPGLAENQFQFQPPAGVDVIDLR